MFEIIAVIGLIYVIAQSLLDAVKVLCREEDTAPSKAQRAGKQRAYVSQQGARQTAEEFRRYESCRKERTRRAA